MDEIITAVTDFFAKLTDVQLVILIALAAVFVALIINIICSIVFYKKISKKKAAAKLQQNYYPAVVGEMENSAAYTPAQSEPLADEGEEEEIPTVGKEIAVVEAVAEMQTPDGVAESATRYNRSFHARLIQSDDDVKEWYGILKNCILSYDKVSSRMSWKYESFAYRRNSVAKVFIKGKTLYLYLALNPADYAEGKYKIEDVSNVSQFADTPSLYRIKSEKRVRYAQELIDEICVKLGSQKIEREAVNYYEPYESDAELMEKELVKCVVEDANSSFIGAGGSRAQDAEADD